MKLTLNDYCADCIKPTPVTVRRLADGVGYFVMDDSENLIFESYG